MKTETVNRGPAVLTRLMLGILLAAIVAILLQPGHAAVSANLSAPASAAEASADGETILAAPGDSASTAQMDVEGICAASTGRDGGASLLLPTTRWADSTTTFNSHIGSTHLGYLLNKGTRESFFTLAMSAGNAMWSGAAALTQQAAVMCPLYTTGAVVDNAAADIGSAIKDSPLMLGIVVITLLVLVFQSARTGVNPMKQIGAKVAVAGLFAVMLIGAQNSSGGEDVGMGYEPGFGSPGWFAISATNAVTTMASGISSFMVGELREARIDDNRDDSDFHSGWYLEALHNGYSQEYEADGYSSVSSVVPLTLSMMWEDTGLEAWKTAQFGADNDIGDKVYSFLLDSQADIPVTRPGSKSNLERAGEGTSHRRAPQQNPDGSVTYSGTTGFPTSATQRAVWNRVAEDSGHDAVEEYDYSSIMFDPPNSEQQTRVLVSLAMCSFKGGEWVADDPLWHGWNADPEWEGTLEERGWTNWFPEQKVWPKDEEELAGECEVLLESGDIEDGHSSNWSDDPSVIKAAVKGESSDGVNFNETRNFLLHVHGAGTNGVGTVIIYVLAALCVFLVFGAVSLGVMLSKIVVVVMIATVFILLAMTMLPNVETARLGKFVKTMLGSIVFAAALVLIISTIAFISSILVEVVSGLTAPGGILMMLATGFAPILAVVSIHWVFKSVLGLPSPFKLTSAMAYGSAANGMGGAAVSGAGQIGSGASRLARRGMRAAGSYARHRSLKSALGGGGGQGASVGTGSERLGAMPPAGSEAQSGMGQKLEAAQRLAAERKAASQGSLYGPDGLGVPDGQPAKSGLGQALATDASKLAGVIGGTRVGQGISDAAHGLDEAAGKLFGGGSKAHPGAITGADGKVVNPRAFSDLSKEKLSQARGLATGAAGYVGNAASLVRDKHRSAGTAVGRVVRKSALGGMAIDGLASAKSHIKGRAKIAAANARAHPVRTAVGVGATMAAGAVAGPLGVAAGAAVMAAKSQADPSGRSGKQVRADARLARQNMQDVRQEAQRRGMSADTVLAERKQGHEANVLRQQRITQAQQHGLNQAEAARYVDSGDSRAPSAWADEWRTGKANADQAKSKDAGTSAAAGPSTVPAQGGQPTRQSSPVQDAPQKPQSPPKNVVREEDL